MASWTLLCTLALAVGAFVARVIGLDRANELFIDELTYSRLAAEVNVGHLPNLAGDPFLLHPPGAFIINAFVMKVFGLTGPKITLVYDLRWTNAVLGAVMVALAFLITRRLTSIPFAAVAAGILALDPFVLRNDSRVMLETPTTVALLLGWLIFLTALDQVDERRALALRLGAGLILGWAILTKDVAAIAVFLPLAAAVIWRRTLQPREAATTATMALVPYVIYLVVLGFAGQLGVWVGDKATGISRLAGSTQSTGFNAPGAPSFVDRLVAQVGSFASSYVLIAAGIFVGVGATLSPDGRRRFIGIVATTCGLLGVYAAFIGTLEEQFGYYVVVTSVLAATCLAYDLVEKRPAWRVVIAGVAAVMLLSTAVLGVIARTKQDDAVPRTVAWLNSNVAPGSIIGLTDLTSEFAILPQQGYIVLPSLASLAKRKAQYAVTRSAVVSQGYAYSDPRLLPWLQEHARPVHTESGPSSGETTVWQIDRVAIIRAVAAGYTLPPIRGEHP